MADLLDLNADTLIGSGFGDASAAPPAASLAPDEAASGDARDKTMHTAMLLATGAMVYGDGAWAAPQVTVETNLSSLEGCACAACSNAPSEQGTGAVEVKTDTGAWDPVSTGNPLPGNVFVAGLAGTRKWSEGPPAVLAYNFSDGSQSDLDFFNANSATLAGQTGTIQANHQNLLSGAGNAGDIRADIRSADILISSVAGLQLNEVNTFQTGSNDFRFMAFDNLSGLNGIATFPGTDPSADFFESFILYNNNTSSMTVDPELGGASNRQKVAIHEWLHGLGIGHPQDTGNGSGTFTTGALTGVGDDELDNDRYTVMSAERGGIDVNNQTDSFGYSATPMVLDIAALQYLYGSVANHTTDTTYTLTDAGTVALDIDGDDGTVSIGRAFYAIWDTSGNDTITYSGVNAVVVNLNEATLSDTVIPAGIQDIIDTLNGSTRFSQILPVATAGEARNDQIDADFFAGGFFSRIINTTTGAADRGGYAIANSLYATGGQTTIIENATGGSQADILIGNEQNNAITGNGGDDLLLGADGNDTILGGSGVDEIYGGNGNDTIEGGAFVDTVFGGAGNDVIQLAGGNFLDIIDGGADTDTLDASAYTTVGFFADLAAGQYGSTSSSSPQTVTGVENVTGTQNADTITGSSANNVLDGQGGDDTITGGDGSDTLDGGAGNDTITDTSFDGSANTVNGGDGNDTLINLYVNVGTWDGGADIDTIDFSFDSFSGNFDLSLASFVAFGTTFLNFENLVGTQDSDIINGSAGANTLDGQGGNDTVNGGAGDDTILGGGGDDNLNGGNNVDSVSGGAGNDVMTYTEFEFFDHFDGGSDVDTVVFDWDTAMNFDLAIGQYFEFVFPGLVFDIIDVENLDLLGTGSDTVQGSGAANVVNSGDGNDTVFGGNGGDTLNGGAGNDTLRGGSGLDTFTGGAGDDSIYVDNGTEAVTELVGGGNDTVFTNQTYTLAAGQEIETLRTNFQAGVLGLGLIGNEFANSLIANAGNNTLNGGAGADQMRGLGGNDQYFVDNAGDQVFELVGNGTDTVLASISYTLVNGIEIETFKTTNDAGVDAINLTGNEFANSMTGNAGNNILNGGIGADTMRGLAGNDSFVVDNAGDVVIELGGNGTDTVFASVSHALQGGQEIENLRTNNQAGVAAINLTGNNLVNNIQGNNGDNVINGGGGIDTMLGFAGNDTYIVDNAGDIVVENVGGGTDTVSTGVTYTLQAGREVEFLQTTNAGGVGAINLTGNEFAQTITGNAGNNTLNGKQGNDTLTGGNGLDSFAFDTALGAGNVDTITSFIVADDTFVLENAIFTALAAGALAAGAFNVGAAATQADDRIIWNNVTKALLYDSDGVGGVAAIQFAAITNVGGALSAGDFSVI